MTPPLIDSYLAVFTVLFPDAELFSCAEAKYISNLDSTREKARMLQRLSQTRAQARHHSRRLLSHLVLCLPRRYGHANRDSDYAPLECSDGPGTNDVGKYDLAPVRSSISRQCFSILQKSRQSLQLGARARQRRLLTKRVWCS